MFNLEIKLLGGFAAASPSGPLTFRSDKVRGLLAYLLAYPNEPIARDTLAGLFFPEQDRRRGRKNINLLLTRLRQSLAPIQDLRPSAPLLFTDLNWVQLIWDGPDLHADVILSEQLIRQCDEHPHALLETCPDCLYRLRQVVDLYQGDFLAGFGLDDSSHFDEWRLWQQEQRLNTVLSGLTLLAEQALVTGNGPLAEQYARRHIQFSPWQEHPHRQVMRALGQQGKVTAALHHFALCQKILAEELGSSPSPETWACYQQLLNRPVPQYPTPKTVTAPATALLPPLPPRMAPAPLPQPGTPFFGRTTLLETLSQIVLNPAHRLITLAGGGGMGKTRLAIALAQRLQRQFTHGASFVPLATIAEADEKVMVQVIAAAVGYIFTGTNDPVIELLTSFQAQHHLLVLDNFEHLLDNTPVVTRLLDAAPHLTIVVTSRHPLNLPDEQVYPIAGLGLPQHEGDAAADSVQLFIERATRTGARFTLDETTLAHITRISGFLQGWPLALELAASWINEFSLAEIENTLIQHLERLHTQYRDIVDRHKSMTAVLGWSYTLLAMPLRQLLGQLSVFQGGWTEEAAMAIAGVTPALMQGLHQHAFIEKQADGRFSMHELVRQFAQSHVKPQDDVAAAHSHYYLHWLKDQSPYLLGAEPQISLPVVGLELNNIRKAWYWALKEGQFTWINECVVPLVRYYTMKGLTSTALLDLGAAAEQIQKTISPLSTISSPRSYQFYREWQRQLALAGLLWAEQAIFYLRSGAIEAATAAADRAWVIGQQTQDRTTLSRSLQARGSLLSLQGESRQARETLSSGAALAQAVGQERIAAECLLRLVRPKVTTSAYLDEARIIAYRLNDSWLKNEVARSSGGVAFYEGQLWQAYEYWQENLSYSRQFANIHTLGRLENNLGDLARRFGNIPQALAYYESALQASQSLGDPLMEVYPLEGLTRLHWQTGDFSLAEETSRRCEQLCQKLKLTEVLGYLYCVNGRLFMAQGQIGKAESAYHEAIAFSQACHHAQIAMEAYAGLAEIFYQQGNLPTAKKWVDTILTFIAEGNTLEGFTETSWIYLTCYLVLRALGDKRMDAVLLKAQSEIKVLAQQIADEHIRRTYLEMPVNVALLKANSYSGVSTPTNGYGVLTALFVRPRPQLAPSLF
ncbi:MAG: tetratricopeptide repeat protein [Chloroflexi bacterium]|nr:tetratricopeptide repeat protein [Chloroflexota bacterium]MBP8054844.1 tetratricopeptide repeat protein [Chloroflexota bacterium]